jgi:hypothetical protein
MELAMKQVRVERSLTVENGHLLADVTCWFPVDPETEDEGKKPDLYNVLIRPERSIWGIPLTPQIGATHDYWERYIYVQKRFPLSLDSIHPALEWMEQKTQEAIDVITSIVDEYKTITAALPSLETVFIDLP